MNSEKDKAKDWRELPWREAWPTAPALCVPMHTGGIIGFKAGMSTAKMVNVERKKAPLEGFFPPVIER